MQQGHIDKVHQLPVLTGLENKGRVGFGCQIDIYESSFFRDE